MIIIIISVILKIIIIINIILINLKISFGRLLILIVILNHCIIINIVTFVFNNCLLLKKFL